MKKMIGYVLVIVLAVGLAWAAKVFYWKYVGRQAYIGSTSEAIEKLSSELALPKEIKTSFLEAVKSLKPVEGTIQLGDRFDAMIFGSGELKTNVVAAWEDGVKELKSEVWQVFGQDKKEYDLIRPLTCNNWSVVIRPVGGVISTPRQTEPVLLFLSGSPEPYHTITIRLWDQGSFYASPGLQGRDLGEQHREAARQGKLKPYPGRFIFRVEFRDLDFKIAEGKTIYINGEPFTLTNLDGNTIAVAVENGQGSLSIPVGIVGTDTALVIHSPWLKPNIQYPPSGSLKTCGRSTAGICGSNIKHGEPSEFYRLATTTGESNYHFVK